MARTEIMKLSKLRVNPRNPRLIRDERFRRLKDSISTFPEMTHLREIVVDEDMMILGGNMRYRAMKELGIKEAPVKVAENLTEEQKREFIIRDNVELGEWDFDMLANDWDMGELAEWGVDGVPGLDGDNEDGDAVEKTEDIRPLTNVHVLLTIPVDEAMEAMPKIEELAKSIGARVLTSAN